MSLVIPPGYGNAALVFTSLAGTPEFVTTIGVDLSAKTDDYVGAANQVMTAYGTAFAPATDSSLTLDRCTLAIGQDGAGGSVDSDIPPFPMTRTGDAAPLAMSAICRKVTNTFGRRGRGRMFLPGVLRANEVTEGGTIYGERQASLSGAAEDFLETLQSAAFSLPPVLLHSTAPADPSPITALTIQPLVGWIRGRIR